MQARVLLRKVSLGIEIRRRLDGFPSFVVLEKPERPGVVGEVKRPQ